MWKITAIDTKNLEKITYSPEEETIDMYEAYVDTLTEAETMAEINNFTILYATRITGCPSNVTLQ